MSSTRMSILSGALALVAAEGGRRVDMPPSEWTRLHMVAPASP
jgi:hypothetical protein